jgi:hypothetical protein
MALVHNTMECINGQNVNIPGQNVNIPGQNVNIPGQNVNIVGQKVNICTRCGKGFTTKKRLLHHVEYTCKGEELDNLQCLYCHKTFSCISSKCRHQKNCDGSGKQVVLPTTTTHEVQATVPQTMINHQNNYNKCTINNNIIINFPEDIGDEHFAFLRDHIQPKFEALMKGGKPEIGLRRYTSALMEKPENRMIIKQSEKSKYCKIYKDDDWVLELDEIAIPIFLYYISCAALEDTHEYKDKSKGIKIDVRSFLKYLDDLNTENDANENYRKALEIMKVLLVNMTQKYKEQQRVA